MQISKTLFLSCAAALIALQPAIYAADNEAQAKARQALEQLMNTGGSQPAQAVPAQPVAAPVQAPAVVAEPVPPAGDSDAVARAREAMRAKMAEMEAGKAQPATPPQAPAAPPVIAPPAISQPVAAPVAAPAAPAHPVPQQAATDPQAIEKAREALRQKMAELESQPSGTTRFPEAPTQPAPPAVVQQPAPAVETPAGFSGIRPGQADAAKLEQAREAVRKEMEAQAKAEQARAATAPAAQAVQKPRTPEAPKVAQNQPPRQYKPLEGPAVPFSQEQQAKLAELLKRYRADEITPEQYHVERAKIIGQP